MSKHHTVSSDAGVVCCPCSPTVVGMRRGASLMEVVISTFLVGVVMIGALKALEGAVRTRRRAAALSTGAKLAEQLLTEVMATSFEDPQSPKKHGGLEDGESATNRTDFDDVDDYDGWDELDPTYKDGSPMTDYTGWRRQVAVLWPDRNLNYVSLLSGGKLKDSGFKHIQVTVTSPDGAEVVRSAMRAREGVLQQAPPEDRVVVTHMRAKLQVGNQPAPAYAATNLTNHAKEP